MARADKWDNRDRSLLGMLRVGCADRCCDIANGLLGRKTCQQVPATLRRLKIEAFIFEVARMIVALPVVEPTRPAYSFPIRHYSMEKRSQLHSIYIEEIFNLQISIADKISARCSSASASTNERRSRILFVFDCDMPH